MGPSTPEPVAASLHLRQARQDEAEDLSRLCRRSKGRWGYDEAFLSACRAEPTVCAPDIAAGRVAVVEADGKVLGIAEVSFAGSEGEVEKLFVDPASLRRGVGTRLGRWCIDAATAAGVDGLVAVADPNAVPFYHAMGFQDAGQTASESIPGRTLPRLILALPTRGGRTEPGSP